MVVKMTQKNKNRLGKTWRRVIYALAIAGNGKRHCQKNNSNVAVIFYVVGCGLLTDVICGLGRIDRP